MIWQEENVRCNLLMGYFGNTSRWFTLTSSWSESLCSSGLYCSGSAPGGTVWQRSFLPTPAPNTDREQHQAKNKFRSGIYVLIGMQVDDTTHKMLVQVDMPKASHSKSLLHLPWATLLALFECSRHSVRSAGAARQQSARDVGKERAKIINLLQLGNIMDHTVDLDFCSSGILFILYGGETVLNDSPSIFE